MAAPASTERSGTPVGVHLILEREGLVLMLRRANTGFFDGLFSLPGGHVEAGESLVSAACREAAEELGVKVLELSGAGVVHRLSDTNRIDFFFRAGDWQGEPVNCEPDKCDGLLWCDPAALPGNTVPYIRAALQQPGSLPWMFEMGWENGRGGLAPR